MSNVIYDSNFGGRMLFYLQDVDLAARNNLLIYSIIVDITRNMAKA